ncbi:hypothetical protein DENSPDRAFT_569616 [Dentipellis sp. KUC8613]|nr:hypothetical protein DENSPDRAFT_569616 [Dentipellis sp. KUC8613]
MVKMFLILFRFPVVRGFLPVLYVLRRAYDASVMFSHKRAGLSPCSIAPRDLHPYRNDLTYILTLSVHWRPRNYYTLSPRVFTQQD